eukprot:jgi/Pico_ML_1/54811/g674.t1
MVPVPLCGFCPFLWCFFLWPFPGSGLIIEAYKHIMCNFFDNRHGRPSIPVVFDEPKQIVSQHFEDHAYVIPVGSRVFEMI